MGPLGGIIAGQIAALLFELVAGICFGILQISYLIFTAVTSPGFITLPYTSGGIVDIGWPIVRDLANMGFVFALIFFHFLFKYCGAG